MRPKKPKAGKAKKPPKKRQIRAIRNLSYTVAGLRINKPNYTAEQWAKDNDWVGVKSSDVSAIKYDKIRKELYVSFLSGGSGYYTGVGLAVAKDFFNSSSIGSFVHRRLKNHFVYVRLV